MLLDPFREIVDRYTKFMEACAYETAHNRFQHRLATHREHRLWAIVGKRPKSRTRAAGHQEHPIASLPFLQQFGIPLQADNRSVGIDHWDMQDGVPFDQVAKGLTTCSRRSGDRA